MLWFYKQGTGAVGFKHGLLFSDEVNGTTGLAAIATDGTIIGAEGAGVAAYGIDFSEWTFSEYFLFSKGFTVTGAGSIYGSGLMHVIDAAGGKIDAVTSSLPDAQADLLGRLGFGFQNQTSGADEIAAYIEAAANNAWTEGSSRPSFLRFFATASSSITPAEQMRLTPDSNGASKTPLFLLIGTEGLVQVTVGAADSGGTGKRQLVVANAA
jgi:hypothetical protein